MKPWWLLLLFSNCLFAQNNDNTTESQDHPDFSTVVGNPYLFKDWSKGVIYFSNGRVMNQFKLKFDCARNQLVMEFGGSSFVAQESVSKFVLYTDAGKSKDSLVFRKGFPPIGKADENTYYQVLHDGKITLLKLWIKNVVVQKQMIGKNTSRNFEDEQQYYLLKGKNMILLPQERNALAAVFPDKKDALKQFMEKEHLKLESDTDMFRLLEYYYSLSQ